MIRFNKPYLSGNEVHYIQDAIKRGKLSGNGPYTHKCQDFFKERYGFTKCLLTTSCSDALEMSAILAGIEKGDEVIMPSFTFVSTANAFILRGAKVVFSDSRKDHPGMNEEALEGLISDRTKAIVVVHYAGVASDMDKIMEIAEKYGLYVIEDAAQAIDSFYKRKPLGQIGHLGTFSFHETKNIISGEGGMLAVNDENLEKRAEILWEKGTNRTAFFRGEVDKYGWVDVGSSFLPSDMIAAFLWAQLENLEEIQKLRKAIWQKYHEGLKDLEIAGKVKLPYIPEYATNNQHMFYLVTKDSKDRDGLIAFLKTNEVHAVFHYLSLHKSKFFENKHDGRELPETDRYSETLVRLPFYNELSEEDQNRVLHLVHDYFS